MTSNRPEKDGKGRSYSRTKTYYHKSRCEKESKVHFKDQKMGLASQLKHPRERSDGLGYTRQDPDHYD